MKNRYAIAVGGSILQPDGNGNRNAEVAWSDGSNKSKCTNQWGTGGGLSTLFRQPNWQTGVGVKNQYSRGTRQLPDVSAIAYDVAVYFQGQWTAANGTSAAAPVWASGMALVNEGLLHDLKLFGYGPSLFYLIANNSHGSQPYFDVKQGNNLYYGTTFGWDYPTGLGTPNLVQFYNVLYKIASSK